MNDEQQDLQLLHHRMRLVEALEQHHGGTHWDLAQAGSELAADDAATAPLQTSHVVGHALSFAVDCLRSTRMLLTDPDSPTTIVLPLTGQYPLLRGAMEAGGLVLWLLEPNDHRERVSRTLRSRWDDIVQDDKAVLAMTDFVAGEPKERISYKNAQRRKNAQRVRKQKARVRAVADAAGIPRSEMEQGLPGWGPIIREGAPAGTLPANQVHGWWRLISGLAHPSASRTLSLHNLEEIAERDGSGTVQALFTSRPDITNATLEAAALLYINALRLTSRRGDCPALEFVAPPGFPLPPGYHERARRG